jgi:hypothetical protein
MNYVLNEEMNTMCNLSDGVFYDGVEHGIAQGIEQGIEQGTQKTKLDDLKNMIFELSLSFEKAASVLKIPESEWEKYREKL